MEIEEVLANPTGVELWRASEPELQELVSGLSRRISAAEAVRFRAVAELDRRGTAVAAGACSTGRLVAGLGHVAPGTGVRWVELALWLERSPEVAAALGTGAITVEHARVVMATMCALPPDLPSSGRDACRDFLLDVATGDDPVVLRRRAAELLHRLTPDEAELVEERARQRRELQIGSTPVDGLVPLRGCLDVEAAELLKATLSPLAAPRPATDGTQDPRSPAHRMADALVELVGTAADHGCVPGEGYVRPQVTITVDAESLATGTGPPGSMPFLGPLSAAAARRWACDAEVTPVSLDADLVPLDVGRSTYVVSGGLRLAVIARDGGCSFPGCGRPPAWCHAHHVVHWADGGVTALGNLTMLCGHHHRVVHHQGWEVDIGADGHPWFTPPPWTDPDQRPRPAHRRQPCPDLPPTFGRGTRPASSALHPT